MTRSCAVLGCSNRSNREVDKSYNRVPKEVVHKGAKVQKISKRRREKWLSNLSLSSCGAKSKHARICSDHFVKGGWWVWKIFRKIPKFDEDVY